MDGLGRTSARPGGGLMQQRVQSKSFRKANPMAAIATGGATSVAMDRVCVVGLGYIGLPTASLLATKGFTVHGVDTNARVVDAINRGEAHEDEPDLDILVKSARNSGNFVATPTPAPADIFILAVPTPVASDHSPDISSIEVATRAIAPHLGAGNLVILESTSPVGTTERVARLLKHLRPDLHVPTRDEVAETRKATRERVFVAHCPERVLPGQILRELVDNDRVIGGVDQASAERAQQFYQRFVNGRLHLTSARTAELCKLAENSYRDTNIAFANELSLICDRLDVNVWDLIDLANRHPRVKILQPGPGVGGHCIAVDPWFLVHSAPDEARLIRVAREVNDRKPDYVVKKVTEKCARFKEPIIACLGLTYKANVGDWRESPAIKIVVRLAAERIGRIVVVEPHLAELPPPLAGYGIRFAELDDALQEADVVVLLVNHRAFRQVDRGFLKEKVVIDTWGMWR